MPLTNDVYGRNMIIICICIVLLVVVVVEENMRFHPADWLNQRPISPQVPPGLSEGVWVPEAARVVEVGPGGHARPTPQRAAREVAPAARHSRSEMHLSEEDMTVIYNHFVEQSEKCRGGS